MTSSTDHPRTTHAETTFDVDAFKTSQRALWDASAAGWDKWHDLIESWLAPVSARLVELGGVRPGSRVLDLGTGYGEPARTAARAAGPSGEVVGVDLSRAMIEAARRRGRAHSNLRFVEGDLEALEPLGTFDAVLSRLGLMFMTDRAGTLRALRRALKPDGALAAAVWGPPPSHEITTALAPLAARLELPAPPPGAPSPFGLSDTRQFAADLAAASFSDVTVAELTVPCRFRSVDEFVRFNLENLPARFLEAVREKFGSPDADAAWSLVRDAAQPRVGDDGVLTLPCLVLCVRAIAT
jgi:SAM-dependent methyltransferase